MKEPRHRVVLELHRHVGGTSGYTIQHKRIVFPFGKAHELRHAYQARAAAFVEFTKIADSATNAWIYQMNGGYGRGEQVLATSRKFWIKNDEWEG